MQITLNVADSTRNARCCHTPARKVTREYIYMCVCLGRTCDFRGLINREISDTERKEEDDEKQKKTKERFNHHCFTHIYIYTYTCIHAT